MKIFVDENIPLMTVRALREMGYIVTDIRNTPDKGMADDDVWAMVQREKLLLITTVGQWIAKLLENTERIAEAPRISVPTIKFDREETIVT